MLQNYRTVLDQGEGEVEQKRSRFIGCVFSVDQVEAVAKRLQEVRDRHENGSHYVYAYRIGCQAQAQKYCDDGEPSGTAGLPVLDVLTRLELVNVLLVVVRYFGGTLLGRGGLIRAYSSAAKASLEQAGLGEMVVFQTVRLRVGYSMSEKIRHRLEREDVIIEDTVFDQAVTFSLQVRPETVADLENRLREMTAAQMEWYLGPSVSRKITLGRTNV